MSKVRVACFSLSVDGFGAGVEQSLEHPLGLHGSELHEWFFPTQVFRQMTGAGDGTTGPDNDFALRGFDNVGAWILGRNMFSPVRGPWPDESWKGWWGEIPPYHTDVFVLTHHPRRTLVMEGGTTFHFVGGDIRPILETAKKSAKGLDVRLGGGVATIKQFVQAGLVDELHFALSPVILGAGENMFAGVNFRSLGYRCVERTVTDAATHIVLRK
jgi:dihydrofolate reductase